MAGPRKGKTKKGRRKKDITSSGTGGVAKPSVETVEARDIATSEPNSAGKSFVRDVLVRVVAAVILVVLSFLAGMWLATRNLRNEFGGRLNLQEERLTDVECSVYEREYDAWADACVAKGGSLNEFFICNPANAARAESFKTSLEHVSEECLKRLLPPRL